MDRDEFIARITEVKGISESRAEAAWEHIGSETDASVSERALDALAIVRDDSRSKAMRLAFAEEALEAIGAADDQPEPDEPVEYEEVV